MRCLVIAVASLSILAGCGSDDSQLRAEGTTTDTSPSTASTAADARGDDAERKIVALLEGMWRPASVFCPVGMAIGQDGSTTEAPPPEDVLDLTTIEEVAFTEKDVTLTSSCGEISTFGGTFSRCVGDWRVVDAEPSGEAWVATLEIGGLVCEPKERVLPPLALIVSSDSLELEDVTFGR